jgi:hypothetical protein
LAALADLPDLAARISASLSKAGIPHAVSGALAMAAHGFVRATRDIDILVVAPALRLPEVFSVVRGFGFEGEDADLVASLRERGVAELRSGPASVEILTPVLPYHHEVLRRAVRVETGGGAVPFVSAEDLVVLKLLWLRDKDRADVRALIAARRRTLDREFVRRTLRSLVPDADPRHGEFDRMVREAGE